MKKIWNNLCHWQTTLPAVIVGAGAVWLLVHDHITEGMFWTILGIAVLPALGLGKKKAG